MPQLDDTAAAFVKQLAERKREMEERVEAACARVGRRADEVRLIAVTKYATLQATQAIYDLGISDLGESRWQEARHKWGHLEINANVPPTWHFIGHLQTNKVRDVIGKFAWIHSLDRISLAEELQRKAEALDLSVNCLVQVNISGEQTKFGLNPQEVTDFCVTLRAFSRIKIEGLMTMAPYDVTDDEARAVFRGLRLLRDELNRTVFREQPLVHLSMGMSDDFEIAIEEGATMVRLGTALMGDKS